MDKKVYKPVKRNEKAVIKCLVKENQRVHDYNSPLGVKWWNLLLYEAKFLAKNHKCYPKNVRPAFEKHLAWLRRCVNEETDPQKLAIIKRKIWMLEKFETDEWKYLITDTGRLYDDKRAMLWKRSLDSPEWDKTKIYNEAEIMNIEGYVEGNLRYLYPNQSSSWLEPPTEEEKEVAREKRRLQEIEKEKVREKRRKWREAHPDWKFQKRKKKK